MALAAVPHLMAARTDKPPVLDGRLDDPAWQKAPATSAFTQKQPVDGKPPVDRTTVRVLYDDDNVYVGVDCPQSSEVVARLTRRDRWIEADSVSVILDTRGDGKSAFEFAVNAAGVLSDGLHFNDTDYSQDWDENWEGAAHVRRDGWSAELRIPLRALRFPARPIQSWGLEVRRYVSARQELDEWAHIPKEAGGEVSHYGKLDDLRGLRARSPIELRPFVVATLHHHDPQGMTLARGWELLPSAGVDLKWHVSQSLTLDATLLPDFGQVEADQVILNLTNYEIQFPEKRPFFLEGFDVFSSPLQLLYTRRIGRAPAAPTLLTTPTGVAAEQLVQNPKPSTIFGAAKLSGDLGGHWTIGELTALTGRQTVPVQPATGPQVDRVVDPYSAFTVLRLKRDLGANSHVGLLFTGVERLESPGGYASLPGPGAPSMMCPSGTVVALGARCFHDVYVAGVDGRWRSPSGEYVVTGQAIGSLVANGPPRTLLDGTVIKSGDTGPAVSLHAGKEGGSTFAGAADVEVEGRRVDFNDLGFMARQNIVKTHVNLEYRTLVPRGATLETHSTIDYAQQDNLDALNQFRGLSFDNWTKYKNFFSTYALVRARPRHWDDREVGDGAALQRGGLIGFELALNTDPRKRLSGGFWTQVHFVEDGLSLQGNAQLSLRILSRWDLDLLPSWIYAHGEPRYFATQGKSYLFGNQRAQSVSLILRSTFTFTPGLSLQAYAQAIVEAEHYSSYAFFPANGAGSLIHLSDLRPVTFPILTNPDFANGTINASLVARWEYLLGSTLYLVYTHAQADSITPSFGDPAAFELKLVKPRAAEDAVLLKLSYWWG
jgi:hypothetical protein